MNTENGSATANPAGCGHYQGLNINARDAGLVCLFVALASTVSRKSTALFLRDARLVLIVTAWYCRQEILRLYRSLEQCTDHVALCIFVAVSTVVLLKSTMFTQSHAPQHTSVPILPPLIFPCHTTHTRLFAAKHSFTYSYLLVGIPIGWRRDSGTVSCDPDTRRTRGWFSVHNEDYLARGSHPEGLRGKLDDYLRQNDIIPDDLPYAYLVTAPRFLGWSFNPVSFWYLYNTDGALRAMILEVNNTFDERRMYLLRPEATAGLTRFRERWQKDFHVSPFNDRKGEYSIVASDPFQGIDWTSTGQSSRINIDNNITLSSLPPEAKPKLVARIYSTAPHVNPASLTMLQLITFMAQWGWKGFLTNPRILWEARILWAKKRLQVFYRPEVNVGSIGRQEVKEEVLLEAYFCRWLKSFAVNNDLMIGYTSAAGSHRGKQIILGDTNATTGPGNLEAGITVDVLTPEWYAELARAHDIRHAFKLRCFAALEGERMLSITGERTAIFENLLDEMSLTNAGDISGRDNGFRANLIRHLSCGVRLPTAILLAFTDGRTESSSKDGDSIVAFRDLVTRMISVESESTQRRQDKASYDHAALMVLLADRVALGYTGLFRAYGSVLRYGCIFMVGRYLAMLVTAGARYHVD